MRYKKSKFPVVLLLFVLVLLQQISCAFPSKSLTRVNIGGQLITQNGTPLRNQKIELVLPAGYGLNEIDRSFVDPNETLFARESAVVKTDALGSFTHTFKPVPYSAAFWVIPPIGSVPKSPPAPFFLMRVLSDPDVTYSVLVKDNEIIYSAYDDTRPLNDNQLINPPLKIKGQLIEDERDELFNYIADIRLITPSQGLKNNPRARMK